MVIRLRNYMERYLEVYKKYLYISEEDLPILQLIMGSAVSQFLGVRTELLWLVLIGPPSSAKTTMLNPFIGCKDLVIARDDCTGNAMISASDPEGLRAKARAQGLKDKNDPSLVNILDGKLFIIKDMTILLNKKNEADRFWGHLRAAYDGRLEKHSGTIGSQGVESVRFGFLAATTDGSVEGSLIRMSKLGERALYVRMHQGATTKAEDRRMGLKMLQDRGTQHEHEKELANIVGQLFRKCIRQVKRCGASDPEKQNPEILQKVIDLASALARIRTTPMEDSQLPHERNPRTVKQFGTLCDVVSLCRGRRTWTENEVDLCRKAMRSSLPAKTRLLLDYVATCSFSRDKTKRPLAVTAAKMIGVWRYSTVDNQLRQWVQAGVMERDESGRYSMMPDMLDHYSDIGVVLKPKIMRNRRRFVRIQQ